MNSRRLDRGQKLAPSHKRCVDATIWNLDRVGILGDGSFKVFQKACATFRLLPHNSTALLTRICDRVAEPLRSSRAIENIKRVIAD